MSTHLSLDSRFVAQHEDFLRRLARGLVGQDHAAVDDAVQDVWVRAMQSPPRESPRAYLAATLRNGVARLRSRERARVSVERSAARSERIGGDTRASAAGLLDGDIDRRLALHEELTRALRDLPDEQRRALYLRYSEDLTPAEIAARTGEPLGTVKTRLARGLAALRADLDARHGGDRASWATALSLVAAREMSVRTTLSWRALELFGVAAASLVAAALFFSWPGSPRELAVAITPPSSTSTTPAIDPGAASAGTANAPRIAANPAAVEKDPTAQEPPLDPGDAPVRIALIDDAGAPITGAVIRATANEDLNALADWGALPTSVERIALSSAEGVASLELSAHPALSWKLDVEAEGYGSSELSVPLLLARSPLDLGVMRLRPEAILEVEVRQPNGEPCLDPGELIVRVESAAGGFSTGTLLTRWVTPHQGRAVVRGLPSGRARVSKQDASTEFPLQPGETRAVTLALTEVPDRELVELHVKRVLDTTPSPSAVSLVLADGSVLAPEGPHGDVQSGSATYVWRAVPEGAHTLHVVAPGFEPYTAPAPRGSKHWVKLVPSSGVRLVFVDAAGEPVESRALVTCEVSERWRSVTERASVAPAVALPAGDHRLRIRGERFAQVDVAVEALALDEWRDVTVSVAPSRVVTGTVRDALGQVAPGVLVQALAPAVEGDGASTIVDIHHHGQSAQRPPDQRGELAHSYTDTNGRFRLYVAHSGPFVVRAQRMTPSTDDLDLRVRLDARRVASSRSANATELALGTAHEHRGIELSLTPGATVSGRLVGAGHAPFDDLAVMLYLESLVVGGPQGVTEGLSVHDVTVGASGEFVLGPVVPERYVLFARPSIQMGSNVFMLQRDAFVELARFEVPPAGLAGLEVALDGLVAPSIEVRVRTSLPRGAGASGDSSATLLLSSRVHASMGRNGPLVYLTAPAANGWGAGEAPATTAVGRLRLGPEPRWRLWVNDGARGWTIHRDIDLATQVGPIELEVELAEAAVSFVDGAGAPLVGQEVQIAQSLDFTSNAPATSGGTGEATDATGRVDLRLPPGDVEFLLPRPGGQVRVGPVLWPAPPGTVLTVPD